MIDFLTSSFLEWIPRIFSWVLFLFAAFFYFKYRGEREAERKKRFRTLVVVSIVFAVLYAGFLTWGQHYVWSEDSVAKSFLTIPLHSVPVPLVEAFPSVFQASYGYFIFYSLQRFWFPAVLNILVAVVFFWFLKILKSHNGRFFEEGETELGFLLSLLAGWPIFLVFLPLALLSVMLVSIVKMTLFEEHYTTLGMPFLLGTLIAFALTPWLLTIPFFVSLSF